LRRITPVLSASQLRAFDHDLRREHGLLDVDFLEALDEPLGHAPAQPFCRDQKARISGLPAS
jgi:hypothetical protein